MPHYRCYVGGCDSNNKNSGNIVKRGHVAGEPKGHYREHYMTKDLVKLVIWEANQAGDLAGKGRKHFKATDHQVIVITPSNTT